MDRQPLPSHALLLVRRHRPRTTQSQGDAGLLGLLPAHQPVWCAPRQPLSAQYVAIFDQLEADRRPYQPAVLVSEKERRKTFWEHARKFRAASQARLQADSHVSIASPTAATVPAAPYASPPSAPCTSLSSGWEESMQRLQECIEQYRQRSAQTVASSVPIASTAATSATASTVPVAARSEEDDSCRVCMSGAVDCALVPCGHLATCGNCADKLQQCPFCRRQVDNSTAQRTASLLQCAAVHFSSHGRLCVRIARLRRSLLASVCSRFES